VPKNDTTTVYCIDADDDFCAGLESSGLKTVKGSLGYRYEEALIRTLPYPPHESDVMMYNLRSPACYDALWWGPGRNDNYNCEVVKLERDAHRLFHRSGKEKKYSQYKLVSEMQISRGGIGLSSFDGNDILKAVKEGGLPLVYFLNPSFLIHVSNYLPRWFDMTVNISPTLANDFDLPDYFSESFPGSLSKIGKGVLQFLLPIRFRIDNVPANESGTKVVLTKLAVNRVGDILAALISVGKGHIFLLPPFKDEIGGSVELVKNIIPRFQEELKKLAEKHNAELQAAKPTPPASPPIVDLIPPESVKGSRDYIEKIVHEVNSCYRYACYNATGALIRRLIETMIIEIYETHGRAQEIQDKDGNFLRLEQLIGKLSSGSFANISRNTKQLLKDAKVLGDTAVHNRKVLLIKDDIDSEKTNLRVAITELFKNAKY
jgi:hypothetical protein